MPTVSSRSRSGLAVCSLTGRVHGADALPSRFLFSHARASSSMPTPSSPHTRRIPTVQTLELVTYLARPKPEEEREAYVASFGNFKAEAGEERVQLVAAILRDVQGLGDGTEREVEGFFNLLLAVVLAVHPVDSAPFAEIFPKILAALTNDKRRELRRAQYQMSVILQSRSSLLGTLSF